MRVCRWKLEEVDLEDCANCSLVNEMLRSGLIPKCNNVDYTNDELTEKIQLDLNFIHNK